MPFWGGDEKGRTGGAWGGDDVVWGPSVTGGGVALAEGQVSGGWGGHSPKMPENSWMGVLKNSKNWKYACEVFEIEKKVSFLDLCCKPILVYRYLKDFQIKTSVYYIIQRIIEYEQF